MENKKYLAMLMAWDILNRYKNRGELFKISIECGEITIDETLDVIKELGCEFEKNIK